MDLKKRTEAFVALGNLIKRRLDEAEKNDSSALTSLIQRVYQKNNWFTAAEIKASLNAIVGWLSEGKLNHWLSAYSIEDDPQVKKIGVIMAGNIPLVGFHDFLCVLISGNAIDVKLSSDDDLLLPAVAEWLIEAAPAFKSKITFSPRIELTDAVIATGSNNSARYFEYYFSRYPHIIRKNRNSVAVIDGSESKDELTALGYDIFSYFGLGCRNVSKLYIPHGYNFKHFFECMTSFSYVMQHHKYMNNFDYRNAIFLLNKITFLTNNFLIVREDESLSAPVSVLHYQYYNSEDQLRLLLEKDVDKIQCIAGKNHVPFGKTQFPELNDYADGKDVLKFLSELNVTVK